MLQPSLALRANSHGPTHRHGTIRQRLAPHRQAPPKGGTPTAERKTTLFPPGFGQLRALVRRGVDDAGPRGQEAGLGRRDAELVDLEVRDLVRRDDGLVDVEVDAGEGLVAAHFAV